MLFRSSALPITAEPSANFAESAAASVDGGFGVEETAPTAAPTPVAAASGSPYGRIEPGRNTWVFVRYTSGEVVEKTLAMIDRILANAPISIRQVKKSIEFGAQMDTRTGLFFEVEAYSRLVATDDRREGIRAFNEKQIERAHV